MMDAAAETIRGFAASGRAGSATSTDRCSGLESGTCKMGPQGDRNAIADEWLRARGLERLRVVDASIMPDVISGKHQRTDDDDRRESITNDQGGL
jgi:choline dehydrogenase-like flavoprotein